MHSIKPSADSFHNRHSSLSDFDEFAKGGTKTELYFLYAQPTVPYPGSLAAM